MGLDDLLYTIRQMIVNGERDKGQILSFLRVIIRNPQFIEILDLADVGRRLKKKEEIRRNRRIGWN